MSLYNWPSSIIVLWSSFTYFWISSNYSSFFTSNFNLSSSYFYFLFWDKAAESIFILLWGALFAFSLSITLLFPCFKSYWAFKPSGISKFSSSFVSYFSFFSISFVTVSIENFLAASSSVVSLNSFSFYFWISST